jgi:hypothetical protein
MRHRVRTGEWQRIQRGVYAAFSGEIPREAQLWAALLRAGPEAVLSHQTAAELYGLIKQPGALIHVTVPAASHPAESGRIPGVIVHRSRILDRTRHPVLLPPRTRVEDTVLDLIEEMDAPADRYDVICRAIGGRLTTAARLRLALRRRKRFRNRREAESALEDAGQGALSNLERWYLRGVERRHKLPIAKRQARRNVDGQSIYLDNLYEEYLVCVELDGSAAHPAGEQWADKRRSGGTSPPGRSSPCALDTWTCTRRKRSAEPRKRSSAFSVTGGLGSAQAAVWRAATSSAKTGSPRAPCLVLAQGLSALFGERLRRDCRKLKGAYGARGHGLFGASVQLPLRYGRQSSWRCGRSAGV